MSNDAINSWVSGVKSDALNAQPVPNIRPAVRVVRRDTKSSGGTIMEIAEKIRPFLLRMFEGVRDRDGMLLQPAHIRGIALNMAQGIVKEQGDKK